MRVCNLLMVDKNQITHRLPYKSILVLGRINGYLQSKPGEDDISLRQTNCEWQENKE